MRGYLLALSVIVLSVCGAFSQTCPTVCPISQCGHFRPGQTPYSCPNGYVKDDCGCELQTCQCAGCIPFDMNVVCRYGYRTQGGCPSSQRCNSRPPAPSSRCPNSQEPTGQVDRGCISKRDCAAPQLCCRNYFAGGRNCMNGMPVEKVTPFPMRCGTPPGRPIRFGVECSPKLQCPVGYICCPTAQGSQLRAVCRKDPFAG